MNLEIRNIFMRYSELADLGYGTTEELIKKAEATLNIKFPLSYKEFLLEYGAIEMLGVKIFGIEKDTYSSLVENTQNFRKLDLPNKFLVIADIDEFLVCINAEKLDKKNECPIHHWYKHSDNNNTTPIYDSFDKFLLEELTDIVEDYEFEG